MGRPKIKFPYGTKIEILQNNYNFTDYNLSKGDILTVIRYRQDIIDTVDENGKDWLIFTDQEKVFWKKCQQK